MRLLLAAIFLAACAPAEESAEGSGGYVSTTDAVVSSGGAHINGTSNTGGTVSTTTSSAISVGGNSTKLTTASATVSVSLGGHTVYVGSSAVQSPGGSTSGGTSSLQSSTGGAYSPTSTSAECLYDDTQPKLGLCSVFSKGRGYCDANWRCKISDSTTGWRLDCDHDGVLETNSSTEDNCGYCGVVCARTDRCTVVSSNDFTECKYFSPN